MKKSTIWMLLILLMTFMTGCTDKGRDEIVTNRESTTEEPTSEQPVDREENGTVSISADEVGDTSSSENEVKVFASESGNEVSIVTFQTKVVEDTFSNAAAFVKKQGTKKLSIDFSKVTYQPGRREKSFKSNVHAEEIDNKIAAYPMKKIRMYRNDANGSTMDFEVFTNPGSKQIDKIISTEYGSEGRLITNYYFYEGQLNYVYEFKDDIYGTSYQDGSIPGKKCAFVKDIMTECFIDDGKNSSFYVLADYDSYDKFIRDNYDETEKDLVNRAYTTYAAVRDIPGYALISGYVADEYGGILSNVQMKIASKAHDYSEKFTTNGDGYYEVVVPVNEEDWYGVSMTYGDFTPVTIDDIKISAGTTDYSLGITYMAAQGENKHDTAYYLLDATKRPDVALKDNEYEVILTYRNDKAQLIPSALNLKKNKIDNSQKMVISTDTDTQTKYFVTDERGGKSDNTMTYEMSNSEAQVKIYNRNGLVASYQVPVNHAGVVWEVFEIRGTDIIPINNYYYAVGKDLFFE